MLGRLSRYRQALADLAVLDAERDEALRYTMEQGEGFVGILPSPRMRQSGLRAVVGNLFGPHHVNVLHLIPSHFDLVGSQLVMSYGGLPFWCRPFAPKRVSVLFEKSEVCDLPIAGARHDVHIQQTDKITIFTHPDLETLKHMMRLHLDGPHVFIHEEIRLVYPPSAA